MSTRLIVEIIGIVLIIILAVFPARHLIIRIFKWLVEQFLRWKKAIREWLIVLSDRFLVQIEKWLKKLRSNLILGASLGLNDLAPTDNAEKAEHYLQSLAWGLDNDKVRNIAVTGTYGSGKSSILGTFQKRYSKYRYLNVSLASFQEVPPDTEESDGEEEYHTAGKQMAGISKLQRQIETSILQQIFYKVHGREIPDSRFNRIKRLSPPTIIFRLVLLIATLTSLSFLVDNSLIGKLLDIQSWLTVNKSVLTYTALSILVLTVCLIAGYIFRNLNQLRFNKLNVVKGELEIERRSDFSVLNHYLEELIYFFEATHYNVIFFEDLDRFKKTEIFTKLRELNTLLNNSDQIKRRIIFVYAIKDDIFPDKTRTKFFDLIIPVIPVLNSTNSLGKLQEMLRLSGELGNIDETLLSDITLYIDDMRILKNIINEYVIYKRNLIPDTFKSDQLFSIIVYKNMHPSEFAKLESNEGDLVKVFGGRKAIDDKLLARQSEIADIIKKRIEVEERDLVKTLSELRKQYVFAIIETLPVFYSISDSTGTKIPIKELPEERIFEWLIKQPSVTYHFLHTSYNSERAVSSNMDFLAIQASVDSELTYVERKEEINRRSIKSMDEWKTELASLLSEMDELRHMKLKDLMEAYPDALEMYGDLLKDKGLLSYLLRGGFINEMYPTLISYFYEGDMKMMDFAFLRKSKDQVSVPFDYELVMMPGLLKRFTAKELSNPALLNNNLMDFLVEHRELYKEKFDAYASCFSLPNPYVKKFISQYVDRGIGLDLFFAFVLKKYGALWVNVLDDAAMPEEKKRKYFLSIIEHMSSNDIDIILGAEAFNMVVTKDVTILASVLPTTLPKLYKLLTKYDTIFSDINPISGNDSFMDYLDETGRYQMTIANLHGMLHYRLSDSLDQGKFEHENHAYIISQDLPHLKEHIELSMDAYLKDVLLNLPAPLRETKESFLHILTHVDPALPELITLIERLEVRIEDIAEIKEQSLWGPLITHGRIEITKNNVQQYFDVFGLDEVLIDRLNLLNNDEIEKILEEGRFSEEMESAVIDTDELHDAIYKQMVNNIKGSFTEVPVDTLSSNKVSYLVRGDLIVLDKDYYQKLKELHPPLHVEMAEKDIPTWMGDAEEYPFDADDMRAVLISTSISKDDKILILEDFIGKGHSIAGMLKEAAEMLISGVKFSIKLTTLTAMQIDDFEQSDYYLAIIHQQFEFHPPSDLLSFLFKNKLFKPLLSDKKKIFLQDAESTRAITFGLKKVGLIGKIDSDGDRLVVWKRGW